MTQSPETLVTKTLTLAENDPERVALVAGAEIVTYGRLAERVVSAACELRDMGIERGDRVVLMATARVSFAYGYLATHLLGAVAVPLAPEIPKGRRDFIIERVEPVAIFEARAREDEDLKDVRLIDSLADCAPGSGDFSGPDPDDLADLLFTTGTSGLPKGVMLSQANLLAAATNINSVIGNGPDDREVVPLSLGHSFGLGRLRCNLLAGGALVMTRGFSLPGEIFAALEKWKATGIVGVPAGWKVLLDVGEDELARHADTIRYVEIGSAPMAMEQKQLLMRVLPKTKIWMHYGLTEASRSTFLEYHSAGDRLNTIGKATPNVEVRIVGPDGEEVSDGETGELVVRGGMVMKGYWKDPEATAGALRSGWMHTGDVGHKDGDGFVHLHGREDDMINVGGFNVSPAEVERALDQIVGVECSACIGVPDPKGIAGNVVKAFLVATPGRDSLPTPDDLYEGLKSRLEQYKLPAVWEWIDSLPQTSSGKIQRAVLRERERSGEEGRTP